MNMREQKAQSESEVVVSGGRRHVIYDTTTPLVVAPCGRQHPLAGWLPDNPEVPWCDLCLIFHED